MRKTHARSNNWKTGPGSGSLDEKAKERLVKAYRWGVGLEGLQERFGLDSCSIRKIIEKAGAAPPKNKFGTRDFFRNKI